MTGKVIESRRWRHTETGATASPYGAHPGPGWVMETVGYTIQWADGTVGTGRVPFRTGAEAHEFLAAAVRRRMGGAL